MKAVARLLAVKHDLGEVLSATITTDPPQYAHLITRTAEECPICGAPTTRSARLAASVHPTFEGGLTVGIGVRIATSTHLPLRRAAVGVR